MFIWGSWGKTISIVEYPPPLTPTHLDCSVDLSGLALCATFVAQECQAGFSCFFWYVSCNSSAF